jgi:hypothetical protein
VPTHAVTSSASEPTQCGVMTGMGLISHAFAEADGISNPLSVTGKIIDDNGNESLEVVLRLQEVREDTWSRFVNTILNKTHYLDHGNASTPNADAWSPSSRGMGELCPSAGSNGYVPEG